MGVSHVTLRAKTKRRASSTRLGRDNARAGPRACGRVEVEVEVEVLARRARGRGRARGRASRS